MIIRISHKNARCKAIFSCMKRTLSVLVLIACYALPGFCFEPRLRGFDPNMPDLGLPEGGEVLTGLIIAVIVIPLGLLIMNSSKDSSFSGCLGVLFIGAGIVCLLPLLAWLCSIMSAIVAIGILIVVVILVLSAFTSKNSRE